MLRVTGISGADVMALAGIVNVAVLLCGIAFMASCVGRTAAASVCLLAAMLFMWGSGFGWSNEYYLAILPEVGPYPSTLAWGLSLIAFGLVHTWSRRGGALRLAGAVALGMTVTVVHPLTALMFALSFPVLWVWMGRTSWRRRWTVLLYPALALAPFLAWGAFNVFAQTRTVMAQMPTHQGRFETAMRFLSPSLVLQALGPALAGVLFLAWVPRRLRLPLAAGIAMYLVAWVGGSLLAVPLAHRFIFFFVFVLHLTIALALLSGWRIWLHRLRLRTERRLAAPMPAALAASVMLLIPWAPLQALRLTAPMRSRLDVRTLSLRPSPLAQLEETCLQIRGELPPGARIITDTATAHQLPAFGLPMVPRGGMSMKSPQTIDAAFITYAAGAAQAARATHMVLRHSELTPAQMQVLAGLGSVREMPPDVIVVTLAAPAP